MPSYSTLIFDLDGTLTDPALGFVRCINYALTRFDYSPLAEKEITRHIGPPLEQTIQLLTGSDLESHVDEVTAAYRERYAELGYLENSVYPGIIDMLAALAEAGTRLGVCTSKHHLYAPKILQAFDLIDYFEFVSGAEGKVTKSQQLQKLLTEGTIDSSAVMIGDRAVDLTAAHANELKSAGVLWGYGDREELAAEQPEHLFSSPAELASKL